MQHVFISYSRRNKDFVGQVAQWLADAGLDIWIDWEDIDIAVDWLEEIFAGIETSDNFLFIMSPDSLESVICHLEIAHARKHQKRIIPVLYRNFEVKDAASAIADAKLNQIVINTLSGEGLLSVFEANYHVLSRHNWFFLDADDAFDNAMPNLLDAIRTDQDYKRTQTRLLQRAMEWNNAGRKSAAFLRGHELEDGETWLAASGGKEPSPGNLITTYLVASRRFARNRLRTLAALTSGILTTLLVLGVIAFVAFFLARRNADLADSQLKVTTALSSGNPDIALALALEANRISTDVGEAETVLSELAANTSRYRIGLDVPLLTLNLDAATDQIVAVGNDGTVATWPLLSPEARQAYQLDITQPTQAAISADNRYVAIAACAQFDGVGQCRQNSITIADAQVNRIYNDILVDVAEINRLKFSPDGVYLGYTACIDGGPTDLCRDNQLGLIQNYEGEFRILKSSGPTPPLRDLAFDLKLDNPRVFGGSIFGDVRLWSMGDERLEAIETGQSAENPTNIPTMSAGDPIDVLTITANGEWLAAGTQSGSVVIWDLATFKLLDTMRGHQTPVHTLAFLPQVNNRYLVSGASDSTLVLWDTHYAWSRQRYLGHNSRVVSVAVNETQIVSAATDGDVRVWDVEHYALAGRIDTVNATVRAAEISPDGSLVAYTTLREGVILHPLNGNRSECMTSDEADSDSGEFVEAARDLAFSTEGDVIWIANEGRRDAHTIFAWNIDTCRIEQVLSGHTQMVNTLAISPDGRTLLSGTWNENAARSEVFLWDLATGDIILRLDGVTDIVHDVAISQDGQMGAVAAQDGSLLLWDLSSGEVMHRLEGHVGPVIAVRFSPDGAYLLSGGSNASLILWDVTTGKAVQNFIGHDDSVGAVGFHPGGEVVVSGSDDHTVRTWDMHSGQELHRATGHWASVSSLDISQDGTQLATSSIDGTVGLWDYQLLMMPEDALVQWITDNRYVEEFTCFQRQLYRIMPLCS